MKISNNKLNQAAKDLFDTHSPGEWISFLFDIQNTLLFHGEFEALTELGSQEKAEKFAALKYYFESVQKATNTTTK